MVGDPVEGAYITTSTTVTSGLNFEGLGNGFPRFSMNSAPTDTNGAVGATQVVDWVNESFEVFDKATGAAMKGRLLQVKRLGTRWPAKSPGHGATQDWN